MKRQQIKIKQKQIEKKTIADKSEKIVDKN